MPGRDAGDQASGDAWVGAFSAALTLAVLLVTEIIPKTIGATYWHRLAKPSAQRLSRLRMEVMLRLVVRCLSAWEPGKTYFRKLA